MALAFFDANALRTLSIPADPIIEKKIRRKGHAPPPTLRFISVLQTSKLFDL